MEYARDLVFLIPISMIEPGTLTYMNTSRMVKDQESSVGSLENSGRKIYRPTAETCRPDFVRFRHTALPDQHYRREDVAEERTRRRPEGY